MSQDIPTLEDLTKTKRGRARLITLIERHAKRMLTPAEYVVYTFVVDRTLRFNKLWERVTVDDMAEGKKTNDGRWIHRGINMSSRNIYRVLSALLDKGYLQRKPWGYAYQYAINVDCDLFDGYEDNISMTNNFDEYQEPQEDEQDWHHQGDADRVRGHPSAMSELLALTPTHDPGTGMALSDRHRYERAVQAKQHAEW